MATSNPISQLAKITDLPLVNEEITDWQVGKPIVETNSYMLENQINCDVIFEVVEKESSKRIGAHIFYLISRSPVFETMFSERWAQDKKEVQITDVSYGAFLEFLRFLYTEKCTINAENALPLIYLGNKYMHTQIVDQCTGVIEKSCSSSNICSLYKDSLAFHAEHLKKRFALYIIQNASSVFNENDFFNLDYPLMLTIISSDVLVGTGERQIYNSCLRWANHQCKIKNIPYTTENAREVLGDILFQIRLPTMSAKDLADTLAKACVVTSAEKGDIYTYILSKKQEPELKYSCMPRVYSIPRQVGVRNNQQTAKYKMFSAQ